MAITDVLNLTPDVVAEQNPELHEMRKIAFGEDYLQDIEQGTGTARYYTGWGNVPTVDWTQQDTVAPVETVTPVTTDTTPVEGGGGGGDGLMSVAPAMDQAAAIEAMTQPEAYNIPGTMPLTPAGGMEGGVWGPQDYLQPTTPIIQDPTTGDASIAEAIAAQDRQNAFNEQFDYEDAKTQALSGIGPDVILPEAKPDDLLPVDDTDLMTFDNLGGWLLQDDVQPDYSNITTAEAPPGILNPEPYTDRIMDPNLMRIEQERAIEDASYPIAGLSTEQKQLYNQLGVSDIIDPNNPNKDKYGKNIITGADTLGILGNTYEEGVREYVEKYGDKEYTTPLAIQKQKDYKALVAQWDERDAGITKDTATTTRDEGLGDAGIAERIAAENRAAEAQAAAIKAEIDRQQRERDAAAAAAARAPVSVSVPQHISGGGGNGGGSGGMGKGQDPGGGAAGSPFAKGGLIRKQYGSGGIVDLL